MTKRNKLSKKHPLFLIIMLLISVFLEVNCSSLEVGESDNIVKGYVENEDGIVEEAVVRVQATDNETHTDSKGYFELKNLTPDEKVVITAWAEGHYVGWIETIPSNQPITIQLSEYYTTDNSSYDWFSHEGAEGSLSCSHCMPSYDEWIADAHSQSAVNPRFLSMYNGTDVDGNKSPQTEYLSTRDYGSIAMPPDTDSDYYGPGYKLDFPYTAGNCSTCHVPGQAAQPGAEYQADPNLASGIEREGVFCEFCHKISDVVLDPESGLPYADMPGVLSIELLRPEEDEQLFFGNFDDVTRRVSYLPLIEESAYCAACHFGSFWDTTVYNSYGEWLDSSYSDPTEGQTCQDCHMSVVDYNYFVYPEQGGLIRNTGNIYSHLMPGAMDEELLQNAVNLEVEATREEGEIQVQVKLTNEFTGHDVPTDFPLRQMILLVQVKDVYGTPLDMLGGEIIPDYGGIGSPEDGYYAGLPGKIYMKVLQETWTQVYPSGAYWKPTTILSDNRLSAFETDTIEFIFSDEQGGEVTVDVRVIYRRATKELMDQKSWDTEDILMESEFIELD